MGPIDLCGGTGTFVALDIQRCEGEPPCSVYANTDTLILITCAPSNSISNGTLNVYIKTSVGDIDLFKGTLCDSNACPGQAGQILQLGPVVRIDSALAGQDVVLVMQIQNSEGSLMFCGSFPVHVN